MISVKIPMEIEDYQGKIIMGLSGRQLIFGSLAIGCAVPMYFLLKNVNQDVAIYGAMLAAAPAGLIGFVKKDGYTFDKYSKVWFKANFCKAERSYSSEENETEDVPIEILKYYDVYNEVKKEELAEQMAVSEQNEKGGKKVVSRNGKGKKESKKGKRESRTTEYSTVEITEKSRKRKRKAALQSIKAKRRSLKEAKRKAKKAA